MVDKIKKEVKRPKTIYFDREALGFLHYLEDKLTSLQRAEIVKKSLSMLKEHVDTNGSIQLDVKRDKNSEIVDYETEEDDE